MSQKTSTAALDSFRERQLSTRRRAPRHPAGSRRSNEEKTLRSNETARQFGQAQIAISEEGPVNQYRGTRAAQKIRVILPVILRITFSLVLWTLGAVTMTLPEAQAQKRPMSHELSSTEARHEFHSTDKT